MLERYHFFVYQFDVYNEDFAYFSYILSSCDTHQVLMLAGGGGGGPLFIGTLDDVCG